MSFFRRNMTCSVFYHVSMNHCVPSLKRKSETDAIELHPNGTERKSKFTALPFGCEFVQKPHLISKMPTYGLSGCDRRCFWCLVVISSARVELRVLRRSLSLPLSSVSDVMVPVGRSWKKRRCKFRY